MIKAKNLTKTFANVTALKNVSLTVNKGEFYGLLGPNGAGKTTFINILSTALMPDSGQVVINDFQLDKNPEQIKKSIGVVPQEIALYEDLSARDNMVFWGKLYNLPTKQIITKSEELLKMAGLSRRMNEPVSKFSGGMQRRVNLAIALVHSPKIVFMDEPTVGIDPQSRNHIYEMLLQLQKNGITIIYTTHYMEEAEKLCDRIGIIDHGEIIAVGTLEELKLRDESTESIIIEFEDIDDDKKEKLTKTFGSKTIFETTKCIIGTHQLKLDLHSIIQKIDQIGLTVSGIDFKKKNLESLFLNLTGRTLRD